MDTIKLSDIKQGMPGIMRESEGNTLALRFQQKTAQTDKSDDTRLPAYVSVVEFSTPKAKFDVKK